MLPSSADIISDLYAKQGDVMAFLNEAIKATNLSENYATEERLRQQLLFEIMFASKTDETLDKQWKLLTEIHKQRAMELAEMQLLRFLMLPTTAEAKPDKVLQVLERVNPDKWGKKSIKQPKQNKNSTFEDLMDTE